MTQLFRERGSKRADDPNCRELTLEYPVSGATCQGPAPVDPGKFEGETASANTLALILIRDIKSNRMRIAQQENSVEKRS